MSPKRSRSGSAVCQCDQVAACSNDNLAWAADAAVMGHETWGFRYLRHTFRRTPTRRVLCARCTVNTASSRAGRVLAIFLTYIPTARIRESGVKLARDRALDDNTETNHASLSTTLFVTWLCKCSHIAITRLRHVQQDPRRYEYRVRRLDHHRHPQLTELLANINLALVSILPAEWMHVVYTQSSTPLAHSSRLPTQ